LDSIPAGQRVYQSGAARYALQLTSPEEVRLADGRIMRGARPLKAQFRDGFLILDEKKDKQAIGFLDESPYNKANGGNQFWDFQMVLDSIVQSRREQAIKVLTNPEDRAAIIAALKAEGVDFDLPKTAFKKRETTPAAEA